jgi:DNA-binding Lrp family transcriptional regulator
VTAERRQYVAFGRTCRHNDESIGDLTMTDKDEELVALLRVNAREPVASLARKLGLSRTTVQDRLKKLESNGTIAGYALKLGSQAKSSGISAFVTIYVEPKQALGVGKTLAAVPQVETLYTVSGKFDYVAIVKAPTAEELDRLLDRISELSGVTDVETAVILSTKLDRR